MQLYNFSFSFFQGFPYCGSKLFRLVNESSFSFANKTQVYTGRVEVCLNQSYVPVCSDAIDYDDLDSICKAEHSTSEKNNEAITITILS